MHCNFDEVKQIPEVLLPLLELETNYLTVQHLRLSLFVCLWLPFDADSRILYHMVFMSDTPKCVEITNDNLGRIFDSFNITQGNFNLQDWKGKVGAADIKNEPDNKGNMRATVNYFIQRSKQDDLPAWQEHKGIMNEDNIPF